jgi:hypothetical protein
MGGMRDTGKVVLTFFGSIIFCAAMVGTIQAMLDGGNGNGVGIGAIIIGIGLSMLIMPWLPDGPEREPVESARRVVDPS